MWLLLPMPKILQHLERIKMGGRMNEDNLEVVDEAQGVGEGKAQRVGEGKARGVVEVVVWGV